MANCANDHINQLAIPDLGSGTYLGTFQGGLYQGGTNTRPAAHTAGGVAQAALMTPLNGAGGANPGGNVYFVGLGSSIAGRTWDAFITQIPADPQVADTCVAVNASDPGEDAADMADISDNYWTTTVPADLAAAGITALQVRAVWLYPHLADQAEAFPAHVLTFRDLVGQIIRNVKTFFPNCLICYVAPVHYIGYKELGFPPFEPYYYEQGFGVKLAIEQQINGTGNLNWDAGAGAVVAPWCSWGDYHWTDGALGRADGLDWICPDDVQADGFHQSDTGRTKLAAHLIQFLKNDESAAGWFYTGPLPAGAPTALRRFNRREYHRAKRIGRYS